jgi:YesN/AraC family two-component response regulator
VADTFSNEREFLKKKRQSITFLTETELPLGEISALCGYSTDSYFMKQFKRLTGLTPTEYRNKT